MLDQRSLPRTLLCKGGPLDGTRVEDEGLTAHLPYNAPTTYNLSEGLLAVVAAVPIRCAVYRLWADPKGYEWYQYDDELTGG
jgi:hypothetical protein